MKNMLVIYEGLDCMNYLYMVTYNGPLGVPSFHGRVGFILVWFRVIS